MDFFSRTGNWQQDTIVQYPGIMEAGGCRFLLFPLLQAPLLATSAQVCRKCNEVPLLLPLLQVPTITSTLVTGLLQQQPLLPEICLGIRHIWSQL